MQIRRVLLLGTVLPLALLAGCGGNSGGAVSSTPVPPQGPAAPPPAPPAPPPPPAGTVFDTNEYRRSNAAVQAQALSAYQAGATGQGVVAAVIDSGINTNSIEFIGKISTLSADLAGTRGLQDIGGHGTAVSSVLLGAKNDSESHGVAPSATLLVARTDTPGSCNDPTASNSGCTHGDNNIARGVDLAVSANARVINISLGGSPANSTLKAAIGRATAAGIIIVISAGNDFEDNPTVAINPDPLALVALDPEARGLVLIAGATDATQTIASFSNRAGNGQNFYLTALGVRVRAPDETGTIFLYSGTSFSAPAISGAVALLAQAFPTLTGAQIVDLLLRTSTDLGAAGTDSTYGRGELNLARAFSPQGQLSLSGGAVPVSLVDNGSLSAPMGDAGKGGLAVGIVDSYGRDFQVDLAPTLSRAPRASKLNAALTDTTRRLNASGTATTLALSVAEQTPEQLLLSNEDARRARALAGSVATRINRDTSLALGFATGSEQLDHGLGGRQAPAFLVADGTRGLEKAPQGAFAVRHALGGINVVLAAETGDLRIWERSALGPRGDRYQYHRYGSVMLGVDHDIGPVALGGRLTRMVEDDTVLGARFASALGGGGATSWFGDARATIVPARNWRIGAEVRRGWTAIPASAARIRSTLATQAFSFDVARSAVFVAGDSLALRWAEPLRVTSGGIDLANVGTLTLAPDGRERDLEAVYARALGPGWLTVNSYWRQQPGNFESAPDDIGMAVRYAFDF